MRPEIEKGIPMPDISHKRMGRPFNSGKYRFADLNVGDSFFIGDAKVTNVAASIYRAQRRFPERRFVMAELDGGIRVWRKQ
jgi:hypothetical protein